VPEPTPGDASAPPPEPTPQQEAQVRRLLAGARHDEPVPADVAGRLDAVLADLSRARSEAADGTPAGTGSGPVDLLSRRRRRVARLLVAAAAVLVVGLGVGRFVEDLDQGEGAGSSASSVTSDKSLAGGEGSGAASAGPPVGPRQQRAYDAAAVAAVRPATFRADVARLRRLPPAPDPTTSVRAAEAVRACAPVRAGAGRRVPVRYAGRPAVLVLRPAARGGQVADLYLCGSAAVARSVTLPAP
jgi:hypothetical protein